MFLFDQEHTFESESPDRASSRTLSLLCSALHRSLTAGKLVIPWVSYGKLVLLRLKWKLPSNSSQDQPATSPRQPLKYMPWEQQVLRANRFALQIYSYRVTPRTSAGTAAFTGISTPPSGLFWSVWRQAAAVSTSFCLIPETCRQCHGY